MILETNLWLFKKASNTIDIKKHIRIWDVDFDNNTEFRKAKLFVIEAKTKSY
jgi:hypothetical protein